jgi:hypothetical protein
MSESPSIANIQNKQNREQQYLAVRVQNSNRNSNSNDSGSFKAEGNGELFQQKKQMLKHNFEQLFCSF